MDYLHLVLIMSLNVTLFLCLYFPPCSPIPSLPYFFGMSRGGERGDSPEDSHTAPCLASRALARDTGLFLTMNVPGVRIRQLDMHKCV